MPTEEDNFDAEIEALDKEGSTEGEGGSAPLDDDATEHPGSEVEGDDQQGRGTEAGADGEAQARGVTPGRAEGRIARQQRELQELREREGSTLRELNELKSQMQRLTQPQQETPQQRADRLAAMTDYERMQYLLDESNRRNDQQLQVLNFQNNERADVDAYTRRMEIDSRAKKYQPEVEALLGEFRKMGFFPKREACYFYLLGMKVANAKTPSKGQQTGVTQRRQAQASRPVASGGDVGRSRAIKSLEDRLDGQLL
jgi:hypothetical protein